MQRMKQWLGIILSVMLAVGSLQAPVYAVENGEAAIETGIEAEIIESAVFAEDDETEVDTAHVDDEIIEEAEESTEAAVPVDNEDEDLETIDDNDEDITAEIITESDDSSEDSTFLDDLESGEAIVVENITDSTEPVDDTSEAIVSEDVPEENVITEAVYEGGGIPEDAEYWCGHYYRAYPLTKTPLEAKAYCDAMGGYLATSHNYIEEEFLRGLVRNYSGYNLAIIGGTDEGHEGEWTWMNGEELIYSDWTDAWNIRQAHEPNGGDNENYVVLQADGAACVGWHDISADTTVEMFICEWGSRIDLSSLSSDSFKLSEEKFTYNGKTQSPGVTICYNGDSDLPLYENLDYTVRCTHNVNVGTATVQITGVGRYTGSISFNYYITPAVPDTLSLSLENKLKVDASWEGVKYSKGYILQYSTDSDFIEDVVTIKKEGSSDFYTCVTGSLKGKTQYSFRLCAIGDLNNDNCRSDWSKCELITTPSGLWMTIFSNKNNIADVGGHAFLNIENETDEDVYIGNYKLSAGDNAYLAGRGIRKKDIEFPVKQSEGGVFINFEGVQDKVTLLDDGDNYYRDFSWFTVEIQYDDLLKLYSCMKEYGIYSVNTNNCAHFASKTWNSIVDEKYKVPSTGVPLTLKNYITNTLKGKTATILKLEEKELSDALIMDTNGDLMPCSLNTKKYWDGINSLKVTKVEDTSVTLSWDTPRFEIGLDQYNITDLRIQYALKGSDTYSEIKVPSDCTEYRITGLKPGTEYSFKIYGVSDHLSTSIGIVTGEKNTTVCEAKTEKNTELPGKTTRGDMFNLANNVKVTWNAVSGAKYYKVYRSGIKDPVIVTSALVGYDNAGGLVNGQKYTYKIVASLTGKGDSSGDSPLSYSKVFYRLKTVAIRSVKNTAPGKVTVKYDKTTSGDSYVLQYCEREDMVGAKTKVVLGANNTSYVIGGLKKGKTYYISIRVRKKVNGIDYYTTFGVPKKIKITQ